ncbi:phage portal protein [Arthrobacter russicus]|uniref:Phage portal protein, SPP1 Gp6-like n=1 Tax=Arthrobacter russicus TaxID=172040 RepID=A0ABU1JDV5_9MICC|nr:phage portal protein [Arthrobacter russicus]MDR6270604.1 hypothetical protein [Arthrobacter russicus]
MLDLTTVTGSDDWWLMRLAANLGNGFGRLGKLASYRDGSVAVPDGASMQMREAYIRFVSMARLNFAEPICEAVTSRQQPTGFRTGAPDDELGDNVAMGVWRNSQMEILADDVFDEVSTFGRSYALTSKDGFRPLSAWNTLTEASAANELVPGVGITVGFDPVQQHDIIILYRDGYSRRAVRAATVTSIPNNGTTWYPGRSWEWIEDPQPIPNLGEGIPIVPFTARKGIGQFERHTDALDRINHTVLQRLTITAMQAFRQRALSGNLPREYPPGHPLAGQPVNYDEMFSAGPAALWLLPPDSKVWESSTTDVTPILTAVEKDLKHIASVTSTPLYILSPDASTGSAEGASLAREALNAKVTKLNRRMSASFERMMGLHFRMNGDSVRADISQIETIWEAPGKASISEQSLAASQAKGSMSRKMIQERIYNLTPAEMQRDAQYTLEEALLATTEVNQDG